MLSMFLLNVEKLIFHFQYFSIFHASQYFVSNGSSNNLITHGHGDFVEFRNIESVQYKASTAVR